MKLEFGFGKGVETVVVPEKNLRAVLVSNPMTHERTGEEAVRYALRHPVGTPELCEIARPGQKVVIVTSDISRPLPTYDVLPPVLRELGEAGVSDDDITVVFALGSHRHMTEEERRKLAGEEAAARVRLEDSDPDDCVLLGTTSKGTPVDITRRVAEADLRILLGNVEFHYFAGYSGGVKALMPGCSTPAAIQQNHRLMIDERASAGNMDHNPVRDDLEEALRFCPVDFIVNAVLDEHKHIVFAAAGDVIEAHRDACAYLDEMYRKPIPAPADIVIVSQGGAPKDANLYQTQKALDNSKYAVRDGGTIILIGACNEGLGSASFERWLLGAERPEDLITGIGEHFELGGHKAAAIAMVLRRAEIDLVSEMDDDFVRSIFLCPKHSAQEAFDDAMRKYGPDATVIAMPFGGATLPVVRPSTEEENES